MLRLRMFTERKSTAICSTPTTTTTNSGNSSSSRGRSSWSAAVKWYFIFMNSKYSCGLYVHVQPARYLPVIYRTVGLGYDASMSEHRCVDVFNYRAHRRCSNGSSELCIKARENLSLQHYYNRCFRTMCCIFAFIGHSHWLRPNARCCRC